MAAFAADAVYRLVSQPEGDRLLDRYTRRDDKRWPSFYTCLKTFLIGCVEEESWLDLGIDREAAVWWAEGCPMQPDQAEEFVRLLRDHQTLAESIKVFEAWRAAILDELVDETDASERPRELGPAGSFAMSVMVPYLLRHLQTPQEAYRELIVSPQPRLRVLADLVYHDPSLIREDSLQQVLFTRQRGEAVRRLRLATSRIAKPPQRLKRNRVLITIAGAISWLGEATLSPLVGREVRELFDLATQLRAGNRHCREGDLPKSPESLQKAINRSRKEWWALCDPDRKIPAAVRALRAMAA